MVSGTETEKKGDDEEQLKDEEKNEAKKKQNSREVCEFGESDVE